LPAAVSAEAFTQEHVRQDALMTEEGAAAHMENTYQYMVVP
jgi:hypothetical protein